jgi:deoxyribodipyrimidine photolyase
MSDINKEYENLITGLEDVELDEMSTEESKAYLQSQGYDEAADTKELLKFTTDFLRKHTWKYQAAKNREAMEATSSESKWLEKSADEIKEAYNAVLQNPHFKLAARNLEDIGIEEMRTFLESVDDISE